MTTKILILLFLVVKIPQTKNHIPGPYIFGDIAVYAVAMATHICGTATAMATKNRLFVSVCHKDVAYQKLAIET